MPFLTKADFNSVIRLYQLDAITAGDDTIVQIAIDSAIEEVTSIFTPSNKKEWLDGRPHYDIVTIFAQVGSARNPLMLENTKVVAIWHLIFLCNTGLIYAEAESRYDRTIIYLNELATGVKTSGTLPQLVIAPPDTQIPWQMGSRRKFHHD